MTAPSPGRGEPVQLTVEQLDSLVTWTLVRAAHRVERSLTEVFAGHGLTPMQFGVLAHLATEVPMTQADLARAVLVRPQSMHQLVGQMVERGLVERTGARGRGRVNRLVLTRTGSALLERVWPAVLRANDLGPAGLDAGRAEELNAALHALLRWTGGEPEAPAPPS